MVLGLDVPLSTSLQVLQKKWLGFGKGGGAGYEGEIAANVGFTLTLQEQMRSTPTCLNLLKRQIRQNVDIAVASKNISGRY